MKEKRKEKKSSCVTIHDNALFYQQSFIIIHNFSLIFIYFFKDYF